MKNHEPSILTISIDQIERTHLALWIIAGMLLLAHGLAMALKYGLGHDIALGIVPLFDFYEERNIPTYFSSINLLLTSACIFLIALNPATSTKNIRSRP